MLVQALGALAGAPFLYFCGIAGDLTWHIAAMICFGLSKGMYDSNIWAAFYDVVAPSRRGTAVGLMNMVAWLGAGLGPVLVGEVVRREILTLSEAIGCMSVVYIGVGCILLLAAASRPKICKRRRAIRLDRRARQLEMRPLSMICNRALTRCWAKCPSAECGRDRRATQGRNR